MLGGGSPLGCSISAAGYPLSGFGLETEIPQPSFDPSIAVLGTELSSRAGPHDMDDTESPEARDAWCLWVPLPSGPRHRWRCRKATNARAENAGADAKPRR